jgi:hypothetical protein
VDNSAVTIATGVGAANAPLPPVRMVPSGKAAPPDDSTPSQGPRQSDADFLAHQALVAEDGDAARQTYARFIVDPRSHDVHVEIIDASKQEVIRTIPGDDLRRLAQDYRASNGLVLDSTA